MSSIIKNFVPVIGGTISGLNAVYDAGSYPEGEKTVNGKQVLVYSPFRHGGSGVPIHADNFARGLFKIQKESSGIILLSLSATYLTQLSSTINKLPLFKRFAVQTGVVAMTTYVYGIYRGSQPIGAPERQEKTV